MTERQLSIAIRVLAVALAISVAVTATYADEVPAQRLPTVVVLAEPERGACVKDDAVQASFDCLNAELAALVARQSHQHSVLQAAKSAAVPRSPTEQGLFNQTAMRVRMGNTFGHSVYPQRPPAR